jgi:adenine-specific DNA-methyltransferase
MALIDALLDKVSDRALRRALREQVDAMLARQSFGLVFQQHAPETVELHNYKVRRNCKVRIKNDDDGTLYRVERVKGITATVQSLMEVPERWDVPVDDLVVIREFGDPIYPGLRSTGTVNNGGDKPPHLVINAENFHALETLLYTHEGKIDAIYIDPPYNTRDRDWKYNNDYVDSNDVYRHSKWLAMMDRRLRLAKRLLNADNSVLIITIDEKEYLHLGLLLDQAFPEARIQMISSVIAQKGVARAQQFYRTDEYVFFVMLGDCAVQPQYLDDDWRLGKGASAAAGGVVWSQLRRSGTNSRREDRPSLFYPIFVDPTGPRIHSVGEALPVTANIASIVPPAGMEVVWPVRSDGAQGNWQQSRTALMALVENGYVRVGRRSADGYPISYLKRGSIAKITSGQVALLGRHADGGHVLVDASDYEHRFVPGTSWNLASHDATYHGTQLLSRFIGQGKFNFPKSLYAVEDALRFFIGDKPDAVVLDFFAGSGTTMHAVARLNKQDGGARRSICITNNEVSDQEAATLREQGFRPGDAEWEALGICEHVTKPRIRAAVTGVDVNGQPVVGDYKFVDEFPMAEGLQENVEFLLLTYEDPDLVTLGRQFKAVAPLLWLKAGGRGARIDKPTKTWSMPDEAIYGILFDTDEWRGFVDAVIARPEPVAHAFIVTDSDASFQQILSELPTNVEATQLYTDYIRTFEINTKGRA